MTEFILSPLQFIQFGANKYIFPAKSIEKKPTAYSRRAAAVRRSRKKIIPRYPLQCLTLTAFPPPVRQGKDFYKQCGSRRH